MCIRDRYASISSVLVFSLTLSPGFIKLTTNNPIETAHMVVKRYVLIVFAPIDDSLEISFKSEIPLIKDARIKGIAMSFSELMKIVPKGLIQLVIKIVPPLIVLMKKPNTTPATMPIKIFK